jgi:uncharacterized protein
MASTHAQQIFVNLPVKDLKKSIAFFTKLGFTFNKKFTNANATCMIVGKNIYSMLLVEKYFKGFTKKKVPDAKKATEVIISLQFPSKKAVDDIMHKAIRAGAKPGKLQDIGWMYQHSFADLDGHQWEVFFMDEKKMPKQ